MRNYLFFFLLILLPAFSFAGTVVSGSAVNFKGESVQAIIYTDLITFREKVIATTNVDQAGNFEFNLKLNDTRSLILKIDNQRSYLYVEPDKSYKVVFPKKESDPKLMGQKAPMKKITILGESSSDLNKMLDDFNNEYNKFSAASYDQFSTHVYNDTIKIFIDAINEKHSGISNKFFRNYVKYKLGQLDRLNYVRKPSVVYLKYLDGKPILYNNPTYMKFFNEFFAKELKMLLYYGQANGLSKGIENSKSFSELKDIVRRDKLISGSEETMELVLLKNLFEVYKRNQYDKKSIISVLESAEKETKFTQIKEISGNIIISLQNMEQGTTAPAFTLYDKDKLKVSLSDFKGKHVYLSFWKSSSPMCIQEMAMIEKLNKKYGRDIQFISVNVDQKFSAMTNTLVKKNYSWTMLHFGLHKSIIGDYNVLAVPVYYLIGPDGKLLHSPAAAPSSSIERSFNYIIKKLNEQNSNSSNKFRSNGHH